jgi:hypothetical protein
MTLIDYVYDTYGIKLIFEHEKSGWSLWSIHVPATKEDELAMALMGVDIADLKYEWCQQGASIVWKKENE